MFADALWEYAYQAQKFRLLQFKIHPTVFANSDIELHVHCSHTCTSLYIKKLQLTRAHTHTHILMHAHSSHRLHVHH